MAAPQLITIISLWPWIRILTFIVRINVRFIAFPMISVYSNTYCCSIQIITKIQTIVCMWGSITNSTRSVKCKRLRRINYESEGDHTLLQCWLVSQQIIRTERSYTHTQPPICILWHWWNLLVSIKNVSSWRERKLLFI